MTTKTQFPTQFTSEISGTDAKRPAASVASDGTEEVRRSAVAHSVTSPRRAHYTSSFCPWLVAVALLALQIEVVQSWTFSKFSGFARSSISQPSSRFRPHARLYQPSLHPTHLYSAPPTSATGASLSTSTTASSSSTVDLSFCEYYAPKEEGNSNAVTGTPVLLLHGLLGSKRNFASLATSLGNQLETKRRILGVDLRNHGENGKEQWQDIMSYRSMAQDVLQFLDQQQLDKVVLVGHSMGGKVVQTVALLQPERVEGLVVLDMAPVEYSTEEPHWKTISNIITTLKSIPSGHTKQEVDKLLRKSIPDPALRAFCLTNYDPSNQEWAIPINHIADNLNTLAGFDISGTMDHADGGTDNNHHHNAQQYHGDVFFIHGGQSKFVRHAHIETIAQFFPNHMLTTIRGAGHWVHAEAPDDTIALLKRYLDR